MTKEFNKRLDWVMTLSALYIIGAGLEMICGYLASSILISDGITPGMRLLGGLLVLLASLGSLIVLVSYIIAGILFLILLYHACSQAMSFKSPFTYCSPGMAAGCWFIPFANLYMPHEVMSNVRRAATESAGKPVDNTVVHLWWAAFVGKALYGVFIYFVSPSHPENAQQVAFVELLLGIGGTIGVIAGGLFYWMLGSWRVTQTEALKDWHAPGVGSPASAPP